MSKNRGKFLFFGVIIGFIAGLFLAPKKGSDLRKDAKEKFDEVKENPKDVLHETFNEVKEKINNLVEDNSDFDEIKITEDEIVISKSFDNEGELE